MRRWACIVAIVAAIALSPSRAFGQDGSAASADPNADPNNGLTLASAGQALEDATEPEQVSSTIQIMLLLTVLALAPSILVMMTCFTRIIIVLGLLRQAMATQQLPPNQVLIGLALFMTFVVMAPVYDKVQSEAISPYIAGEKDQSQALAAAEREIRGFMIRQIEAGDNSEDVYLFLNDELAARENLTWAEVPTMTLVPSFVISELKIAFVMGFRIYLPFLIIDMVIASVLISMGMLMLPPVLISLPFKLLLFVLSDGWHLVVGTLMSSFN